MRANPGHRQLQTILIGLTWLGVLLLQACSDESASTNMPATVSPKIILTQSSVASAVPNTTPIIETKTRQLTPTPSLVQSKNSLLKLVRSEASLAQQFNDITALAFSPNSQTLAIGKKDGSVKLENVADSKELKTFKAGETQITALAFSSDGQTLLTGTKGSPTLNFWSTANGTKTSQFDFKSVLKEVVSANYSPDNKLLGVKGRYVSGGGLGFLVWSVQTTRVVFKGEAATDYKSGTFAFSPDSKSVIYSMVAPSGFYVDLNSWSIGADSSSTVEQILSLHGDPNIVTYNPDGKSASVTYLDMFDRKIKILNISLTKTVNQPTTGDSGRVAQMFTNWLSYTKDRTHIISSTDDELIEVWDVKSGQQIDALPAEQTRGLTVTALSPDGKYLVTGHSDGAVKFWEVK